MTEQLMRSALATQDPKVLFALFEQALELAKFNAAQLNFAKVRDVKLNEQIARQTAMIANLEKTLWNK